jgi:hypothetical protein
MRHGDRKINVNKEKLINQILANKENHIKEYEKAVVAYKKEALKQLAEQLKRVEDGALDAKLELVEPVNNADNYDKVVDMFQWEENKIVELTQNEFREYVQDETDFAMQAKMSNAYYLGS